MARKPVTQLAGGKGPRQHIWDAIRCLAAASDKAFNQQQIWEALPSAIRLQIDSTTIRDYRRCLVAGGYLERDTPSQSGSRYAMATYRLVRDTGMEAPRVRLNGQPVTQGLAQEQMWRTLRIATGDTNARELAAHASTPAVPVDETAAGDYLRMLHLAGYLLCTKEARTSGGTARYRLLSCRNTGPRPPMICRTKVVYDPNESRVVWSRAVSEEDAVYGK